MSKAVIPVVIVVIVVVAGAYFLLASGSKTTTNSNNTTTHSGSQPGLAVNASVDQFMQDLNSRSVDSMATFYAQNAVVVWSGATGGLSGRYAGTNEIMLNYAATVGKSITLMANISNYAQKVVSPTQTNATFLIKLRSNSTEAGIVTADISVSQEWHLVGASWQITKENWAYTLFDSSYIDQGQSPVTTFPQWDYQLKGGNPNLVSEKSFEWHSGPFVAGAVYAFLFGLVALTLLRLGTRAPKFGSPGPQRRLPITAGRFNRKW